MQDVTTTPEILRVPAVNLECCRRCPQDLVDLTNGLA